MVDGLFSHSEDLRGPNIPEQHFVRRFEEEPSSIATTTSNSCTLRQLSLLNALGGCRKVFGGLFSRSEDLRGPNIPEQQFVQRFEEEPSSIAKNTSHSCTLWQHCFD